VVAVVHVQRKANIYVYFWKPGELKTILSRGVTPVLRERVGTDANNSARGDCARCSRVMLVELADVLTSEDAGGMLARNVDSSSAINCIVKKTQDQLVANRTS
jgi:hypothetical protein